MSFDTQQEKQYRPETLRILSTFSSTRGIKEYTNLLGFENANELLGSLPRNISLLDIGSGRGAFSKELFGIRPDIIVTNVSPSLVNKGFVKEQRKRWLSLKPLDTEAQKRHDERAVSAINPELPFSQASFDVVFDLMGSVYYGSTFEQEPSLLNEIVRVLKPGGKAFVGPITGKDSIDRVRRHLSGANGITVSEKRVNYGPYSFQITKLPI